MAKQLNRQLIFNTYNYLAKLYDKLLSRKNFILKIKF